MGDTSRRDYRRPDGETLYWPMGPFKLRLPFLHYRFEWPDYFQGLLMCAVDLAAIPLMTELLGMPFEAALAVDPGYTPILVRLGEAARADELQGKAIRDYREALERDPGNLAAISGEGAAMAEKGAMEKARLNLAKVQSLCGDNCPETRELAAAIAAGPHKQVLTAEATVEPQPQQN